MSICWGLEKFFDRITIIGRIRLNIRIMIRHTVAPSNTVTIISEPYEWKQEPKGARVSRRESNCNELVI